MTNAKDNKKAKKKVNKKSKQNHLTQNIDLNEWLSKKRYAERKHERGRKII